MDIEKLIEQLNNLEACAYGYHINGEVLGIDCSDFEQIMVDAAEEISKIPTLQAELEQVKRERDAAQSLLAERIGVRGAEPITTAFGLPLDRLRELAQADKMIGKTVWLTKWFTKNVQIANPPLQRTIRYISVCKNGEILMHLKDGAFTIQLIGDCAFTSQEEAKAALQGEQEEKL